ACGQRAHRRVERGHEALELGLARRERAEHRRVAGHRLAEVVRLESEQRLVDDRRRLERAGRELERLVEGLCAGLAPDARGLRRILRGGRLVVQRASEALDERLEVGARVGGERGQYAVELYRARGVGHRQGLPRAELLRVWRAGVQVDVEVALEEDARLNA